MNAAACTRVFTSILQGSAPTVGAATSNDYVPSAAGTLCTFTYQRDGANDSIQYNANTGAVIAKAPLPPKPPELPNTSEMTPEEYMEKLQAEKRSAELSVQKLANDRDRVDEQIEVRFGEF